ncbi:LOW QUALITY PROTEIN: probable G-protein coupled receptor 150 [Protobothrops mucrosquamatus]|uniref:LOW QUALITY PROTEIN: probable G-protein coupled receptor 150 n=1 Tax=Protobothrops mucrosquamatus TaxID=103944 RepID=UPI0010FB4C70|nr:LOW QUALITY PROTEIN: probable G-protein coupled receptor 150 [Protobothrops mucrosquamatus]
MADALEPDSQALGANLSSPQHPAWNLNLSFPSRWALPGQSAQTIGAGTIMLLALVGNCWLLYRLRCGGCCCGGRFRRRRKMDFLLAHLAIADLYGCGLALLSQLPPAGDDRVAEPGDAGWLAGDTTCRLLRFLRGSGLLAPSHMLVLIALERQRLAKGPPPPQESLPPFVLARSALVALGWLLALLLALPQLFVYRLVPSQPGGRCLSIFPQLPRWHGQVYAVYEAITGFVAPACLLGRTCSRILAILTAWRRRPRPAAPSAASPISKCASRSPSAPRSLPRARIRALQLTLALAALFALCGFPRFILELALAFAFPDGATQEARTTLSNMMAATNSAINPYVCLLFHSYQPWARRLQRSLCRCPDGQPRRQARHRQRLSPRAAADRAELWLCPCQTKTPAIATAIQLEKEESRAICESRF